MSERVKYVFFVNCGMKLFQTSFRKSRNSEVIVFSDVKKRLTSREVNKEVPPDDVVRFHIVKKVNSFFKSSRTDFLYYHVEEVDDSLPRRIRDFQRANPDAKVFLLVEDESVLDRVKGVPASLFSKTLS